MHFVCELVAQESSEINSGSNQMEIHPVRLRSLSQPRDALQEHIEISGV